MIRTMIIDDEYLIRERLKRFVEWDKLGFELAGEAEDGEMALEMLNEVSPQLALVDINMPMIDGLEFSKRAKEINPDLHIIFLTGYSHFDYVKSALQIGAANYILKPIDMDELTKTLAEVKETIEEKARLEELTAQLVENIGAAAEKERRFFVARLLEQSDSMKQQELISGIERFCPGLLQGEMMVLSISPDRMDGTTEPADRIPKSIDPETSDLIYRFFMDELTAQIGGEATFDRFGRVAVVVPALDSVQASCLKIMEMIDQTAGFTVTIGIGYAQNCSSLERAYREAMLAMRHKAVYGGGRIITYDQLPSEWKPLHLHGIREQLLIDLRLNRPEEAFVKIQDMFAQFAKAPTHLDQMYFIVYELIATLNVYAEEQHIELTEEEADFLNAAEVMEHLQTPARIEEWLLERYASAHAKATSQKRSSSAKLVDSAKAYIDEHYGDCEMDLGAISQYLHLHPNYLSRIFKAESGMSITEYITMRRMNRAREMLLGGYKNIEYIAEQIGYSDPHYFSKCFKKFYQVPPSRFSL